MADKPDLDNASLEALEEIHDTVHGEAMANGEHPPHDSFAELLHCVKEIVENATPILTDYITKTIEFYSLGTSLVSSACKLISTIFGF